MDVLVSVYVPLVLHTISEDEQAFFALHQLSDAADPRLL